MAIKEKCGVVAGFTYDDDDLLSYLHNGLASLQHRGQESVGISTINGSIETYKSAGLVSESPIFSYNLKSNFGIGHNRYSTTGESRLDNAQPIEMVSKHNIKYSFAFNGNIRNYDRLKEKLTSQYHFNTDSDSELLAYLFGINLGKIDINEVYKDFALLIDGSYSLTALVEDKRPILTAIRDPLGFKPLCIGENKDGYFIASESVAFSEPYMNARLVRDVNPGEAIIIDHDGVHSNQIFKSERHAHCMFEWVYFARPDSIIEGVPVYKVRKKLGECLAKDAFIESDYVIPVPDSGRGAAIGYSQNSNTPLEEGFQLDRYQYQRIFILPEQTEREKKATKKLNVLPSVVKGKKIVIIDDSIVRGTNMKKMCISKLRKAGAREIHVRVSCPPLIDRCPYGIDFHQGELIASKYIGGNHEYTCEQVCKELGADSLYYNTIQDLINSIGLPKEELCLGCLTSNYPNMTI